MFPPFWFGGVTSANPDSSLEIPPSSEFHDCPIVSNTDMKLVETTLLKGDINVSGPQPAVEPSHVEPSADSSVKPLVEGITQNPLPAAVVFQQKLFGSSFSSFQSVTIESTTLVMDPVAPEARTSDCDTLNVLVIEPDATTADVYVDVVLTTSPMNLMFLTTVEMPTLVTIGASLLQIYRPYVVTGIPNSPLLAEGTEEETLDKAHSHLLEGMHILNEVFSRTKARSKYLAACQLKFEQDFEGLQQLLKIHDRTDLGCQEELKRLNQDLQSKFDDTISQHTTVVKELEEVSQQYQSLKSQYTNKERYAEALEGKNVLYSYPGAQHQIVDRFSEMVTRKYSLFSVAEGGGVDIPTLKETLKSLDPSGGEGEGSLGEV
ncbi:unnamed protein product [Lactuca virosa]|uniref:Uncharacterized protein n=1 Tax=Lactuca virosa TaxID=75947 RepID=A0AAU9P5X3_9ASTR|nr:unnamed protein product [Lactuca virosa]